MYGSQKIIRHGSVFTDKFNSQSNLDFIVDFNTQDANLYAENYFNLKFGLEATFKRQIDLLEEKSMKNPYLKMAIENQRQLLY